MTELTACDTSTKTVIADTDRLVLEAIGEVVFAFGHCTDKDADAFVRR